MEELARWIAYDRERPIGDDRLSAEFADLKLTVAQLAGAKSSDGKPFTLSSFLLFKPVEKDDEPPMDKAVRAFFSGRVTKK